MVVPPPPTKVLYVMIWTCALWVRFVLLVFALTVFLLLVPAPQHAKIKCVILLLAADRLI